MVVEVEYLFTPVCLLHNHLHFSLEFVGNLFRYPWHASCKIEWQFPQSCSTVRGQIVGQINAWEVSEIVIMTSDIWSWSGRLPVSRHQPRLPRAPLWSELSVQPDQQLRLQGDRHTRHPRGQASDGHCVSIIVIMCSGMWMTSASSSPRTAKGVQCPPSQAPRHGKLTYRINYRNYINEE